MRVILDECVPLQVRNALVGHDPTTAQRMGWGGMSNGDLLSKAEQAGFEVFIVVDKICAISKILPTGALQYSNYGRTIVRHWKNIFPKFVPPWKVFHRVPM